MTIPTGLSAVFANHPDKRQQWHAFLNRHRLDVGSATWAEIIAVLGTFLLPPLQAAAAPEGFVKTWVPASVWADKS